MAPDPAAGHTPAAMTTSIEQFTLRNGNGLEATLVSWGAVLASLRVPDRAGRAGPVVLGFDDPERYRGDHPCFGAICGRYANRIAGARFDLDGRRVALTANEGANQLHGGPVGFHRVNWRGEALEGAHGPGVRFSLTSPDGDQGFPGRLEVEVVYTLSAADELRVDYRASTDAPTVVNLTHHSYFNLHDGGASPVVDHELELHAGRYLPVDVSSIPTGELADVSGTRMDFTRSRRIGAAIDRGGRRDGYDHCYVVDGWDDTLRLVAMLRDRASGRVMELWTTEPGVQLYTANHLEGIEGHDGVRYGPRHAVCLEAQHFPDSPNRAGFPSTRLDPGQVYVQTTVHRFRVE